MHLSKESVKREVKKEIKSENTAGGARTKRTFLTFIKADD